MATLFTLTEISLKFRFIPKDELLFFSLSCYRGQIDAHGTKVATDYTVLATKRAQNVKAMWHRQYSNANAVHWRLPERPERRNVLDYLHEVPVATV